MRNRITASTTVRCVELYCCCAVRLIKCNGRAKKTRPLHNVLTINTQEENQRFRTIMEMCRKCGISVEFFHNKCVDYPSLLYNVSRSMPNIRAAFDLFPPHCCSALSMRWRSASAS